MKKIALFICLSVWSFCICLTILSLCSSPNTNLGNGFVYNDECFHIIGKDFDIPPSIQKYEYDDTFIVLSQRPTCYFDDMYDYPANFQKSDYACGLDTTYYWIINKKENFVWGPLLPNVYDSVRTILKIRLKMQCIGLDTKH